MSGRHRERWAAHDRAQYGRGLADGARGRGSRARYRRAVVDAIENQTSRAKACCKVGRLYTVVEYVDRLGALHQVDPGRVEAWHENAARRARRILATLDAGRPERA